MEFEDIFISEKKVSNGFNVLVMLEYGLLV